MSRLPPSRKDYVCNIPDQPSLLEGIYDKPANRAEPAEAPRHRKIHAIESMEEYLTTEWKRKEKVQVPVGFRLKALRVKYGLTQRQVAVALGIKLTSQGSATQVSQIERGVRMPSMKLLRRWFAVFELMERKRKA